MSFSAKWQRVSGLAPNTGYVVRVHSWPFWFHARLVCRRQPSTSMLLISSSSSAVPACIVEGDLSVCLSVCRSVLLGCGGMQLSFGDRTSPSEVSTLTRARTHTHKEKQKEIQGRRTRQPYYRAHAVARACASPLAWSLGG